MKKLLLFVFLLVSKLGVCDTIEDKYFRLIYQISENDSEVVVSLTKRNISKNKILKAHCRYWKKYDLDYFDQYLKPDSADWNLCRIDSTNASRLACVMVPSDCYLAPQYWWAFPLFTKYNTKLIPPEREQTSVFKISKEVFRNRTNIILIERYWLWKHKEKKQTTFSIKITPKVLF